MQTIVDDLAQNLLNQSKRRAKDSQSRILVGLCGIPGSGKSQLAIHVINRINAINDDHQNIAIVVGMDGWHLTREQLSKMPDPQLAKDRRGAAWTFDDKAFAQFAENLRSSSSSSTILAPSFDHAKKDPIQDDIEILPFHQIVLIEGLYANLNKGEWWSKASSLYDERWLIECDERVARSRLIKRHVETGVAQSETEAEWRVDNNDLPNGRFLLANITEPYKRIKSQDDEEWKGSG